MFCHSKKELLMKVTFDKIAKIFILNSFNKSVNEDGDLVENNNPTQAVLTRDGFEISEDEFGGVIPGSTIFIKNDLPSVVTLSDELKSTNGHSK